MAGFFDIVSRQKPASSGQLQGRPAPKIAIFPRTVFHRVPRLEKQGKKGP